MEIMQRFLSYYRNGSTILKSTILFVATLLVGAFISSQLIDGSIMNFSLTSNPLQSTKSTNHNNNSTMQSVSKTTIDLQCNSQNLTDTCNRARRPLNSSYNKSQDVRSPSCPEYFRWIHEDLRPWSDSGVTKDMVERANRTANFRLVVVSGRAFIDKYSPAFQTRDLFTWWGILQLLRRYPGRVPDLDLMFDCDDLPVLKRANDRGQGVAHVVPPPLFRYSGHRDTLDIVFPDWSFWGWPEINIKPWEPLLEDLKNGNKRMKWTDREPYAYWKGNFYTGASRLDLLKCNVSKSNDWHARLYGQDWNKESREGFKQSNLGNQCTHRYKIYIEGRAWSVSEKYILACNSPTLLVDAQFYDFFTRGLMPMQHYWPIRKDDMCRAIKFAVEWGNKHTQEAQEIGNAGSHFVQEELKMDYVYDYMLHLLTEYAKLLKYKPTIPKNAFELCLESMACPANGLRKQFLVDSVVNGPTETSPCTLPPPFNPFSLQEFIQRNENSKKGVRILENEVWESKKNMH